MFLGRLVVVEFMVDFAASEGWGVEADLERMVSVFGRRTLWMGLSHFQCDIISN